MTERTRTFSNGFPPTPGPFMSETAPLELDSGSRALGRCANFWKRSPASERKRTEREAIRGRQGGVSGRVGRRSGVKAQEAAEVVNNLRRLFKAIQEHSKAILRKTGLSGPQVWALTILGAEPEDREG